MAEVDWTILDQYSTDGSLGIGPAKSWSNGDVAGKGIWMDGLNNAISDAQYALKATADGQIPIGDNSTHTFKKAVPTGSNGVHIVAGAGTLDIGMSSNGFVKSVEIDLAAGSAGNFELFTPDVACTLLSAYLVFSTTSGVTPANISVGNSAGTSADYVASVSTSTSAAQFDRQVLTLLASPTVAANTTVYLASDGAGDSGKVVVYLKYKIS
jgi:hypothetical protein